MRGPWKVAVLVSLTALNLTSQQPSSLPWTSSERLNRALPHWLRVGGEYRARVEGFTSAAFRANDDDLYVLSRFRVNLQIQPAAWVKLFAQGQDARVFAKNQRPLGPPFRDTLDLRMAYVELGDVGSKAVGIRVGRQELAFGEQRLIGSPSWQNTSRSFDAIRATLRHGGYRLDAFAASIVNIRDGEFNRRADGNNFHGLYGGLEKLVPRATVEPYLIWRLAPRLDMKTTGLRWVGTAPRSFDYGTEMAVQTGSFSGRTIGAWAGHWLAGYTATRAACQPRLIAEYNYASGDRDPGDNQHGTFDQLYPNVHDKYGLADQISWRNIHHLRYGIECKPHAKWQLATSYHRWWLASSRDGLYNNAGATIARIADGSGGRSVGWEIDFQATLAISKSTQLSGGYARLFPGSFLKRATPGHVYGFPYLLINHRF